VSSSHDRDLGRFIVGSSHGRDIERFIVGSKVGSMTSDYKIGICCFSTNHATSSSAFRRNITCSRHDITKQLLTWT
jgi:hypothetical protein